MKTVSYKDVCMKLLVEGWPNPFKREIFLLSRFELPFTAIYEVIKLPLKVAFKMFIIAILPLAAGVVLWYLKATKKID